MLVLTRRLGESIVINGDITVTVVHLAFDKVRIGISAPREASIGRQETSDRRLKAKLPDFSIALAEDAAMDRIEKQVLSSREIILFEEDNSISIETVN